MMKSNRSIEPDRECWQDYDDVVSASAKTVKRSGAGCSRDHGRRRYGYSPESKERYYDDPRASTTQHAGDSKVESSHIVFATIELGDDDATYHEQTPPVSDIDPETGGDPKGREELEQDAIREVPVAYSAAKAAFWTKKRLLIAGAMVMVVIVGAVVGAVIPTFNSGKDGETNTVSDPPSMLPTSPPIPTLAPTLPPTHAPTPPPTPPARTASPNSRPTPRPNGRLPLKPSKVVLKQVP